MPIFTVTLPVTLVIEADSTKGAELVAGFWSVSMKQATHGVELQPVPTEIRALSFDLRDLKPEDISADFRAYVEMEKTERGPDAYEWAKACGNFNIGLQPYWDFYEFDKRIEAQHPGASKRRSRVRYACTYCGAWREADPAKLIVSMIEGNEPVSEGQKAVDAAKSTEGPFMMRHLKECGPRGGTVRGVYPDNPEWETLAPDKRED
jgi:hypothetical protein